MTQDAAQNAVYIDDFDLPRATGAAADFGDGRYGYVVTPNADHLIRLKEDGRLREAYRKASFVVLDSRFVALLLRLLRGLHLPVCTGSDLTAKLFSDVVRPDDKLVLVGGSTERADLLRERYGLRHLVHFNPPMGFINSPEEVARTLRFIEVNSPFRFCLLAIGSPQQEILAQRLSERGVARGLALCVGASIDFLTGEQQRAPRWMQYCGLEWLHRLAQNPKRMAHRYLVRGLRIFPLVRSARFELRNPETPVPVTAQAPAATLDFAPSKAA